MIAVLSVLASAAVYAGALEDRAGSAPNALALASPASPLPQEGYLVLRGGQVFQGKISREGDRYRVEFPHGDMLIRATDVETCCQSLDEAYRSKRSLLHVSDVRGHIALAEWCLQNNLLEAVALELSDVVSLDPQNPMAAHLERRLHAALNPPQSQNASSGLAQALPGRKELDQLSKSMPTGVMETFTNTVQPLLMNSCSINGCHGSQSQCEFQLLRMHPGRAASRRLTQRNLHAVMEWIDRDNPQASPLLTKPLEPHGPKGSVIFGDKNAEQYRQLVNWVAAVVQQQKVQSISRPAVAARKTERNSAPDANEPALLDDHVQQAAHATSWPPASSPAAEEDDKVEAAVFTDPYLPESER